MIRKILILSLLIAITLWFVGAHLIKRELIESIERINSDNIKFSYQDTMVSGFPFCWEVKLLKPKITIVDQRSSYEISVEEIKSEFDYALNSTNIDFGKIIKCNEVKGELVQDYKLSSKQNMIAYMNFKESLFFSGGLSQWREFIDSFRFNLSSVIGTLDNREIFSLSDFHILSAYTHNSLIDRLKIKLQGDYQSSVSYLKINKAYLLVDFSYLINDAVFSEEKKLDFERKIEIDNMQFRFDNAALDLNGFLKLTRSSLPSGELNISMAQYQDIVDVLVPEDFMISKSYIKKVIAKATLPDLNKVDLNGGNLDFKILFSDKGISIGKLNLLELKLD